MFIKPWGLEQALCCTYLKSFIRNKAWQRLANRSKNPCGEIILPNLLDSNIYQQECLKWVGEPGMMALNQEEIRREELKRRNAYHNERMKWPRRYSH
jgi:hypothetical protein